MSERRMRFSCTSCGETNEVEVNVAGLQKMLAELEAEDGEEEEEDDSEDEVARSRSYGMRSEEDEQRDDPYERRGVADRSPYFKYQVGDPGYGAPELKDKEGGRKRSTMSRGVESAKKAFRESYGRKPRKNPRLSHYGVPPRSGDVVTGR